MNTKYDGIAKEINAFGETLRQLSTDDLRYMVSEAKREPMPNSSMLNMLRAEIRSRERPKP